MNLVVMSVGKTVTMVAVAATVGYLKGRFDEWVTQVKTKKIDIPKGKASYQGLFSLSNKKGELLCSRI